jgi:hemerythrin superfamily protein
MDAIDLLRRQHQEMERALAQVLAQGPEAQDDAGVKSRFSRLADQLTLHIESEEQVFYPAVKAQRTEDILLESLEEHLSLKRLLADLIAMEPGEQMFEPKFKVLKEQTEHHHREEEENLFPKVMKLLDAAQRAKLGEEMLALQQELGRKGEPREIVAGETEAAAPL